MIVGLSPFAISTMQTEVLIVDRRLTVTQWPVSDDTGTLSMIICRSMSDTFWSCYRNRHYHRPRVGRASLLGKRLDVMTAILKPIDILKTPMESQSD